MSADHEKGWRDPASDHDYRLDEGPPEKKVPTITVLSISFEAIKKFFKKVKRK